MADVLKVGLIGLDTSHVPSFCKLLNDSTNPHHVPGGKVICGYPGGSPDFEASIGRVEKFTSEIRDQHGVEILDSPEAVAERADLVMITAVDGRAHLGYLEKTFGYGKPTFIDKPFAVKASDAEQMVALARSKGVPLMSCSSLRYANEFQKALADDSKGEITGIDAFGPMALQPTQPGLFWYGCHTVEAVVAALGAGCQRVRAVSNEDNELVTAEWADGRIATIRGSRGTKQGFGSTIYRREGFQQVDNSRSDVPPYASMLAAILRSLPHGTSDVPNEQMVEITRLIEAANISRDADGQVVELAAVTAA